MGETSSPSAKLLSPRWAPMPRLACGALINWAAARAAGSNRPRAASTSCQGSRSPRAVFASHCSRRVGGNRLMQLKKARAQKITTTKTVLLACCARCRTAVFCNNIRARTASTPPGADAPRQPRGGIAARTPLHPRRPHRRIPWNSKAKRRQRVCTDVSMNTGRRCGDARGIVRTCARTHGRTDARTHVRACARNPSRVGGRMCARA